MNKTRSNQQMNEITLDDAGRRVAFVRGIDWVWRRQPEGVVVLDVQTVYPCPGVCVKIGNGDGKGYWYSAADIRLKQEVTISQ
jgi:hypothetical protein